mgnify:CR=1 FL=1
MNFSVNKGHFIRKALSNNYLCLMRVLSSCLLFLIFAFNSGLAQPKLKILFTRFGALKKYEFFPGDVLQYKLKGTHAFNTGKILALHDSTLILNVDSFSVGDIRSIRVKKNNYHVKLFQKIFLIGGIGYPAINLFNNSMNHVSPLLSDKALVISGSFLAASLLLRQSQIKRIRFTKNKIIKIVDLDFEHLNRK